MLSILKPIIGYNVVNNNLKGIVTTTIYNKDVVNRKSLPIAGEKAVDLDSVFHK